MTYWGCDRHHAYEYVPTDDGHSQRPFDAQRPVNLIVGLSLATLGIGATFVTAFTSSLAETNPTEGGLRSAIVNTFHEIGGALRHRRRRPSGVYG
jgi:hypothetical protein